MSLSARAVDSCLFARSHYHSHVPESRDVRLARLLGKARALPAVPGVYLMKDAEGRVVYVGKAARLPDRVSSYFVPSAEPGTRQKERMLEVVEDFEVLECEGEWEALLTEARLIKDIHPRFNVRLTDDKTFPYLAITMRDDFPRVVVTREPTAPEFRGARVYGPFTAAGQLREAVQLLQRVFKFRTCALDIADGDPKLPQFRPCILYNINQCTAPCAAKIGRGAYREDIDRFVRFLDSKRSVMLREMREEMHKAAEALDFERAASIRDQIGAIEKLEERASRRDGWQPETEATLFVDPKRGLRALHKILADVGSQESGVRGQGSVVSGQESGEENVQGSQFTVQSDHPSSPHHLPAASLPAAPGPPPRLFTPSPPHPLTPSSLSESQDDRPIRCIEGIDIAHLAGGETVGSKVCFVDGRALKSEYRRYRIKSVEGGNDDYASIREVVSRRYREAGAGHELYPDVILIDGGLGQLHAALEAFETLNVKPPMVISLAKKEELIYVQRRTEPIRLPRDNAALRLCQHIRDEAHRFAQHYHHVLRRKRTLEEE